MTDGVKKIYPAVIIAVFIGLAVLAAVNHGLFLAPDKVNPKADKPVFALIVFLFFALIYLLADYFVFYNKKGWKKALFVVLSVVVIIGGVEAALRWFTKRHPRIHRHSTKLLWELTPNLKNVKEPEGRYEISTGPLGFRNGGALPDKQKGEFRVLVIGDSTAFGWPHGDKENFPYFLERMLNREIEKSFGKKTGFESARVVNAAVSGYSSYQGMLLLREKGWQTKPDLLIIAFNNDVFYEKVTDKKRLNRLRSAPFVDFLYGIEIFMLVRELTGKARINPEDDRETLPEEGVHRAPLNDLKRIYGDMIDEADEKGVKVLVISLPLKGPIRDFPDLKKYRRAMEDVAKEKSALFLDLYHKWAGEEYEEVFIDPMHPTIKGHREMAREIFEKIMGEGKTSGLIN